MEANMKKSISILTVLMVASLFLLTGCGTKQTGTSTTIVGTGTVKEYTMKANQFDFEPSTITASVGDTVKLHITSEDVAHGFALPDFGISKTLNPGETVDIEFVADKKGTFNFFCNVQCGLGHGGMRGQLVVR